MRVYGVSGLRVIDSSIVPVSFSAHMTAPLYGIAERAYDLLVANPKAVGGTALASASSSSSSTASGGASSTSKSSSSSPTSGSSQNNTKDNAASARASGIASSVLFLVAFISFLLH